MVTTRANSVSKHAKQVRVDMERIKRTARKARKLTEDIEFIQKNRARWQTQVEKPLLTFLEKPNSSAGALATAVFLVLCICASTAQSSLATVEGFEEKPALEILFAVIFTFEFALRILAHLSCLYEFVSQDGMFWVDAAAVTPFYVELVFNQDLSILKVARVIRIVKMGRYLHGSEILYSAMMSSVEALSVTMAFFTLLCLIFGAFIHYTELGDHDSEREELFGSIPGGVWFTILMSSAGVGEILPLTPSGRVTMFCSLISGVFFIAMPLAIIGTNFTSEWDTRTAFILKNDLREALNDAELTESQIIQVFKDMGGEDGMVDFDEFKTTIRSYGLTETSVVDLRAVFDLLDVTGEESIAWLDIAIGVYPEIKQLQTMKTLELADAEESYMEGAPEGRSVNNKSDKNIKGGKKRARKSVRKSKLEGGDDDDGITVEAMDNLLGAWEAQNRAMARLEAMVENLDNSAEHMVEGMVKEEDELKGFLIELCDMSERLQQKFSSTFKKQINGLDDDGITITSMMNKGYGNLMKSLKETHSKSQKFTVDSFQKFFSGMYTKDGADAELLVNNVLYVNE